MATGQDQRVLRQLGTLLAVGTAGELTDGQLLERFATRAGDAAEQAFATLVERHGPMVLRVCRGVLMDPNDVEDAFQATFLVLVQKARSLWVSDSLGPWLHQVALRTASCARSSAARRQKHERVAAVSERSSHAESHDDLGHVLHEEIDRLPERFRVSVVLCDLEGRTHEQAARHLGWPVGTVKSRLTRARDRLRDRLTRRGVSPSAGVITLARPGVMENLLPGALVQATASAAVRFGASRTLLGGSAAILAQGVLTAMTMTRWWKVASLLLVAGATVSGAGLLVSKGTIAGAARAQNVGKAEVAGPGADMPVAEVKAGEFKVSAVAPGSLLATNREQILCQVEGRTTIILSLIPEGTKVKKGDLIGRLDSTPLRDQLAAQKTVTQRSKEADENAKLKREVAEIALKEYEEGVYPSDKATIQGEIRLAETSLEKAKVRQDRTRRARQKLSNLLSRKEGDTTSGDIVAEIDLEDRLDAGEQAILRGTQMLERAQAKLNVLENYTKGKTIRELKSELNKALSEELARKQTYQLNTTMESKLEKQIASCRLVSPRDGIVVYANAPPQPTSIEEGARVRERQMIVSIHDIEGPMQVNAKVEESIIDRVQNGQKANISIDAFPDKHFVGTVTDVAPLPDPTNYRNNRKVYSTLVRLDEKTGDMRPRMTAQVEIPVVEHKNAVTVPVQAVALFDGKEHVAVKKPDGGFQYREVILGDTDTIVVEVKQGLAPGEQVALKPFDLMSEYEKRRKGIGLPTKPPTTKPTIPRALSPAAKK